VVGVAFLVFLELGLTGLSSTGPYLETCLGETFLFLGVCLKRCLAGPLPLSGAGVCAGETWGEPCSAGAFPSFWTGELSGEETISSISVGCYSKGPAGLEVRGVLWDASLKDFRDGLGVDLRVGDFGCEGEVKALDCIAIILQTSGRSVRPIGTLILRFSRALTGLGYLDGPSLNNFNGGLWLLIQINVRNPF